MGRGGGVLISELSQNVSRTYGSMLHTIHTMRAQHSSASAACTHDNSMQHVVRGTAASQRGGASCSYSKRCAPAPSYRPLRHRRPHPQSEQPPIYKYICTRMYDWRCGRHTLGSRRRYLREGALQRVRHGLIADILRTAPRRYSIRAALTLTVRTVSFYIKNGAVRIMCDLLSRTHGSMPHTIHTMRAQHSSASAACTHDNSMQHVVRGTAASQRGGASCSYSKRCAPAPSYRPLRHRRPHPQSEQPPIYKYICTRMYDWRCGRHTLGSRRRYLREGALQRVRHGLIADILRTAPRRYSIRAALTLTVRTVSFYIKNGAVRIMCDLLSRTHGSMLHTIHTMRAQHNSGGVSKCSKEA